MVGREKMRDSEEERGAYRTKAIQTDQPLYMKIICKSEIQIKTYKKSMLQEFFHYKAVQISCTKKLLLFPFV